MQTRINVRFAMVSPFCGTSCDVRGVISDNLALEKCKKKIMSELIYILRDFIIEEG